MKIKGTQFGKNSGNPLIKSIQNIKFPEENDK